MLVERKYETLLHTLENHQNDVGEGVSNNNTLSGLSRRIEAGPAPAFWLE
jgi:hypothetical protein